jgi:hypothetical protein
MSEDNQQVHEIDPSKIGCRVLDVHTALQKAFNQFAESGEDSLEGLAHKIHEALSEMPAFLIGDPQQ